MRVAIAAFLFSLSTSALGSGFGGSAQTPPIFTMSGSSVTCAAGVGTSALTLDPVCPGPGATVIAPIVNSDADGCSITMAKTLAQLGCVVIVELSSSAGGTVTLGDVSNAVDVNGDWAPALSE